MTKLDYSLNTPEERIDLVNKILAESPKVNERYLEILSDYIVSCAGKEAIKNKEILTYLYKENYTMFIILIYYFKVK